MHITIEVTRDNGGTAAGGRDEPVYGAHNGPNCRGLRADLPAPRPARRRRLPVNDGYDYGAEPLAAAPLAGAGRAATRRWAGRHRRGDAAWSRPIVGRGHRDARRRQVPDLAVLLWGPLLRGAVVNLS